MDSNELEEFKREILSFHVPKEDDETMLNEMRLLTEFTRIFPPLKRKNSKGEEEDDEEDDEEEGDGDYDNDERSNEKAGNGKSGNGLNSAAGNSNAVTGTGGKKKTERKKYTPASLEDILCASFVDDKKSTMRLLQPLQMRCRPQTEEQSERHLPPLGFGSSSNKPSAAPPPRKKSNGKSTQPLAVAKDQEASVNRLFNGLSVTPSSMAAVATGGSRDRESSAYFVQSQQHHSYSEKLKLERNEKQGSLLKQQQFTFLI